MKITLFLVAALSFSLGLWASEQRDVQVYLQSKLTPFAQDEAPPVRAIPSKVRKMTFSAGLTRRPAASWWKQEMPSSTPLFAGIETGLVCRARR
jgi:hypothetical protein